MRVRLVQEFTFEAAHLLPRAPEGHKCRRLHGHSFRVEVAVEGEVDPETGWLVDYGAIRDRIEPIRRELDHTYLNEVPGLENPTSEHVARWIWERLKAALPPSRASPFGKPARRGASTRGNEPEGGIREERVSDLRYPIGTYEAPQEITEEHRRRWIEEVAKAPGALRAAVRGLTPRQLDTPYRPGGWTVRQVVHHVPDSHLNAYVRFKLALTEDGPTIKPYHEDRWATLSDSAVVPVEVSLSLLEALHARWLAILNAMGPAEFRRSFEHPELKRSLTLEQTLGLYAWHGRHHVAHIAGLREREGWS